MQIRTHGDEGGCSMAEALPGLSNQDMAVGAEGGGGHTADDDRAAEEGRQKSMSVRSPSSKFHQSRGETPSFIFPHTMVQQEQVQAS